MLTFCVLCDLSCVCFVSCSRGFLIPDTTSDFGKWETEATKSQQSALFTRLMLTLLQLSTCQLSLGIWQIFLTAFLQFGFNISQGFIILVSVKVTALHWPCAYRLCIDRYMNWLDARAVVSVNEINNYPPPPPPLSAMCIGDNGSIAQSLLCKSVKGFKMNAWAPTVCTIQDGFERNVGMCCICLINLPWYQVQVQDT